MILDKQNIFSDGQAITATADSTNIIDLGSTRMGEGEPIPLNIQVEEAFTAAGAATLTITLLTDDNESFSSAATIYSSGAIGKATLVKGYRLPGLSTIPVGAERYLKLVYTVATGPMTAGKINAAVVLATQSNV
jgi:hypothetical protein